DRIADVDAEEARAIAAEGDLQAGIDDEVANRSELISREEDLNDDENLVIHIGNDSLITEELDGTQRLRAEDGEGEIPIRFDGSQGVYVDNYINVTAPDAGADFDFDNSTAGQVNPETDDSGPTTTPVVTVLGTVTGTEVDGSSGGVLIESNGDVTLSQGGGTEYSVELVKVTKFEVYNADQGALAGQPVPGTQEYAVGYLHPDTNEFVELQDGFATDAAAQAFIESTPITSSIYDGIREETTLEGTGGNLQVGGDANIDGDISVASNATINGDISVANNATVGNDLSVGNSLYVADDVYVGGRATGLQSQVDSNRAEIADNADDIEDNRRGIAMVAAMTNLRVEEGNTHALDWNVSYFEDEVGLGVGYGYRFNDMLQFNFAGASTIDFDSYVVRAGFGVQW
ncbi:MAG: hypothetical protein RRC34_11510, partial [Lentisphaeria bacterium]|nr:hypothetical protein [Lentisphaeria bacterium]